MNRVLVVLILWIASSALGSAQKKNVERGAAASLQSKVYKLEELSWPRIDALDRQRTLFILPVGMLEQHGPHLPIGADTIGVTHEVAGVAKRVGRALRDWNIVLMPAINYGQGGANLIGNMPVHPGTYGIRQSTLRSLVSDIGGQVAQNGFKWIFVLNGHATPTHSIALNEACDFVSEKFAVTMLHVTGLFRGDKAIQAAGRTMRAKFFSEAELASFGMDVHAGVAETSGMLARRPDLVQSGYKTLPSQVGYSLEELRTTATAPGWQGYLSAPAKATAAHGRAVEAWWIAGFSDLILRAVRGEDLSRAPRVPEIVPPEVAAILEKELANEAAFGAKLDEWLAARKKRQTVR
jgi:creatinine amidohydrolase